MGNQVSQPTAVPAAVASSLSPKGKRRISKSPFIQHMIEQANKTSAAPKNMPSLSSTWCETSPVYLPRRQHSVVSPTSPASSVLPTQQYQNQQQTTTQQSQGVTTTTTTTTRRPSNNGKGPYYVVSTTTYYVKSPSSRNNSSDAGSERRSVASSNISSNASTLSNEDEALQPPKGLEYTTVEGRKYVMAPGLPYRMVCDEDESDRLIILHFLLKYAFNGNSMIPTEEILAEGMLCLQQKQRRPQVLDIGCGPGTWVLEMATDFPNADFHGIDLCPMFPGTIKPANSYFRQHNILEGLPFSDNTFDYLHMRLMLGCLTLDQIHKLLAEILRVLKPGGYVELRDVEYRIQRPGPVTDSLINQKLYTNFEKKCNVKLDLSHHLSTLLMTRNQDGKMEKSGFVDIHQHQVTIPIGWGGQLGEIHAQNLDIFLRSLDPRIREASTTSQQLSDWQPAGMEHTTTMLTDAAMGHAVQECRKYQSHLNWFVCYGRKPANATTQPGRASIITAPVTPTSSTETRRASKMSPLIGSKMAMGTAEPSALDNGAWESINEFVDGYVD